jgi:uncharacterized cupredoxin-like copper-binding protein
MPKISCLAAAIITSALTLAAGSAMAETIINVVEDGEGGGAMSLKLDPANVSAGPVTFQVKNNAVTEEHEMVVVKLKSPDQKIPFVKSKHRVDERKLKSLGEVSDLKPGEAGTLKVDLKPGTYLVLCNIREHYEAGMATKLTVTP